MAKTSDDKRLELAIALLSDVLGRVSALLESLLGDLFSNEMSVRLMRHAARLDLQDFEDPDFSGGVFDSSASFGIPVDAQAGVAFPRVSLNVLNQEVAYVLTGMTVGSKLTWGPIWYSTSGGSYPLRASSRASPPMNGSGSVGLPKTRTSQFSKRRLSRRRMATV